MKKYIYLICATLGLHCSLLPAMDQASENIKDRTLIAFETLLNHYIIFNHKTACSLALVTKYANQQIKNTAQQRKERLRCFFPKYTNNFVWHIHGGAFAYVYCSVDPYTLTIDYNYLSKKNQIITMKERWGNEPHILLNERSVFFNQKGDACYYASGIMDVLGHGIKREIIEYSVSIDNQTKKTRCVLGTINKKKEFQTISLAHIAKNSFPDLTQAILNSSHQYELSTPWHTDRIKVFHWDGVKLPQRYHKSQLYLDSQGKLIVPS